MQQSPVNRRWPYPILVRSLLTPAAPDPHSAVVIPTSSSPESYRSITGPAPPLSGPYMHSANLILTSTSPTPDPSTTAPP